MSKVMTLMNELIELISMGPFGSDIKVDNFVNDGVPVLNGSNVSSIKLIESSFKYVTSEKAKTLKKANAKRGDIVITHRGTVGQISYIPENSKYDNYVISQSQFRVSLKRDLVDPIYFTYYFHTEEGQKRLLSFKSHVGVPALAQATTNFRLLEFPLISLIEQQKIAKVLSDLDTKIELNNKINMKLEKMAKTLYDYWFVQFDFPDTNGKPYKTSGGKMIWNEELKREIPEGWEVGKLDSIGDIIGGSTPSKAIDENYCFGKGTPWITPKDLSNNKGKKYITRGEFDVTERGLKEASLKIMPIGTVLLSSRAPIGYLAIARTLVTTNQGFKSFVPKDNFSSEYIYFTIQNSIPEIEANSSGSTFKEVSSSTLKTIKTILPDSDVLISFYNKIKPIFKKQDCLELENEQVASLRDWLLPMLMNGQVTVGDIEEQLVVVTEKVEIYDKTEKKAVEKIKKTKTMKLNPVDVYKRTLLAAEIVFQLKDTYTLGHLKLQKMLYLCQELESMALPMNFLKQAMGPYDNQLARSLDKQFVEKKWFEYQKEASLKFKPLENCGKHRDDFNKYFEDQLEGINYLIEKFTKFTSNQIEAVATLYACWKEAIENKELINDKLIITKFYNWSKEKEKFKEENLVKALAWMKKNGIEPKN